MRIRLAIILLAILPLSATAQTLPATVQTPPATAQTTTEDGVRAFTQGDYAAAARILSPLAEGSDDPDPTAQFFMGMLYGAGKGVPRDSIRACSLFAAAAKPSNPFMESSSAVAATMQEMGMGTSLCARPPTIGPKPTSFVLGQDYRVDVTLSGFLVHYHGTDTTEPIRPLPGSRSLPVRYTPLDVTRPVATRRHFLEQFMWWRDPRDSSAWMLGWVLGEIVDGTYVLIHGEKNVASTTALTPPAPVDLESLARVRVNAQGEAEWQVLGGPNPRSEVIPSRPVK
jgi:hypothetical protein